MPFEGSRTNFVSMDEMGSSNSNIKYGREGGCFISTKKAMLLGMLVVVALVLVGVLVHYFGTQPAETSGTAGEQGAGVLVPSTEEGMTTEPPIPAAQLRLPGDVKPSLYVLRLDPYLDEFQYQGHVSITITCLNSTSQLVIHSKGLNVAENVTISLSTNGASMQSSSSEDSVTTVESFSIAATESPAASNDSSATESSPTSEVNATDSQGNQTETQVNQTIPQTNQTNETVPQTNETVSQTNQTVIPTNETVPQTNETATVTNETVQQTNETVSQTNQTATPTNETVQETNQAATATNETVPQTNQTATATNETAPQTNQTATATNETAPQTNQTDSQTNQTVPETAPQTNQTAPALNQTVPATNQSIPQESNSSASNNSTGTRRRKRSPYNHSRRRHQRQQPQTTTAKPKWPPGTPPKITGRRVEEKREMIIFNVEPPLEAGKTYQLDISFSGRLRNDTLYGFYASKYKNTKNETKWMATTQFEAPHAREAFPCFDEPAMKAQFLISIARPNNMTTISNMPIKSTEPVTGKRDRVWDHYQLSPIMSTYLVAFIVAPSDFVSTQDTMQEQLNKTGPEFKIHVREELLPSASYAASIGPRVLSYYEEYFSIPYPLPKLHMAAIPDFPSGAMENWGLLTYRETYLLYDPSSASLYNKELVAIVVAHELAHQWFGNLVTMKWWRDLWLNEGFATYMQYVGSDHVEPTWAMMDKFVVTEQQQVMLIDSLTSTHPVSVRVDNPAQISEIFDKISYNKGAALIRMLNSSITEEVLRKGLTNYLNKWKYKNAEEKDLWDALTDAVHNSNVIMPNNFTVKEMMDTWTIQDGYPVVTVTRNYLDGSATLTQARFTLDNRTSDTLWYIPVSYVVQDMSAGHMYTQPRIWLKKERRVELQGLTKPEAYTWALFNLLATGYFRVNYDERNWALLATHLQNVDYDAMLPPVTRAQLLDDAMNLARAGLTSYETALNLTLYLSDKERDYVPWRAAMRNLLFLDTMLRSTSEYGLLQLYFLKLLAPMKDVVGFEPKDNETQPQTLLRPIILHGLSLAGHPVVENWAWTLFGKWKNSSQPDVENPIPVDMRSVVYQTVMRAGGREEWDFLFERFMASEGKPSEQSVLLSSLANSKEDWLLIYLLDKTLDPAGEIRRQDVYKVWRQMPNSAAGTRVAFNYIRTNWERIYQKYGKDESVLRDIIAGAISGLTTELELKEAHQFRDENHGKFSFAENKLKQEMEALERRVDWHKRHYNNIVTWLKAHKH